MFTFSDFLKIFFKKKKKIRKRRAHENVEKRQWPDGTSGGSGCSYSASATTVDPPLTSISPSHASPGSFESGSATSTYHHLPPPVRAETSSTALRSPQCPRTASGPMLTSGEAGPCRPRRASLRSTSVTQTWGCLSDTKPRGTSDPFFPGEGTKTLANYAQHYHFP